MGTLYHKTEYVTIHDEIIYSILPESYPLDNDIERALFWGNPLNKDGQRQAFHKLKVLDCELKEDAIIDPEDTECEYYKKNYSLRSMLDNPHLELCNVSLAIDGSLSANFYDRRNGGILRSLGFRGRISVGVEDGILAKIYKFENNPYFTDSRRMAIIEIERGYIRELLVTSEVIGYSREFYCNRYKISIGCTETKF